MVFFLSRCTCLPCYRCLRVINFAKIRKRYFAVLGQQINSIFPFLHDFPTPLTPLDKQNSRDRHINAMFILCGVAFRVDTKSYLVWCDHLTDLTLHFRDRHAQLRSVTEITVVMCSQKPYPVWFPYRRQSYPV